MECYRYSFEASVALASLVQHIPLHMITVLIRSLTTDPNVKDASMTQALCRMIDWLSWPLAQHVETWVIALLKGLAAVQKFTILIDVTLLKIEWVFNRLWFPLVRPGALAVLCHMSLSFQHSREAFHLDIPKPTEGKMKMALDQSAWTSQSNSSPSCLSQPSGKSETGKTGLVNLGNTCYMNSVIQALFMANDFRRRVLSLDLNGQNLLVAKLQHLFAFLAYTQRETYTPRSFFAASRPSWFSPRSQQDCSEYLKFLLNRLHEEEKALQILTSGKTSARQTNEESETHKESSKGSEEKTLIEKMFGGKLKTTICCLNCKSVSQKEESFTDLSLAFCPPASLENVGPNFSTKAASENTTHSKPGEAQDKKTSGGVEKTLSVTDLLNYFLAPELLSGDNKYYCGKCGSLQDAEKTVQVIEEPEYLILTLLRFAYDPKCHERRKILDDVSLPLGLTLPVRRVKRPASSLDVGSGSCSLGDEVSETGENPPKKRKPSGAGEVDGPQLEPYALNSVVMHAGLTAESGHYYSYGRHVTGSGPSGPCPESTSLVPPPEELLAEGSPTTVEKGSEESTDWCLFDDTQVTCASFEQITSRFPKDTAYVLFYKKQHSTCGLNMTLSNGDPPLQKDLMDAIAKDNKLYLQEQELSARTQALQAASASCSFRPNGFDYNDLLGSCGPTGGGGGGGFSTVGRLIF